MNLALFLVLTGLFLSAAPALADAPFPDHMQCFAVKDPLRLKCPGKTTCATVDVPGFLPANCKILGAPENTIYCIPAEREIQVIERKYATKGSKWEHFSPAASFPGAEPQMQPQICYKVNCGKAEPSGQTFDIVDQFGPRKLTKLDSKWLCGPAIEDTCEAPDRTVYAGRNDNYPCSQFNSLEACESAWFLTGDNRAASCFFASDGSHDSCRGCGAAKEASSDCENTCGPPIECYETRRQIFAGTPETLSGCWIFNSFENLCNRAWTLDSDNETPASCFFVEDGANSTCRDCNGLAVSQGRCENVCDLPSASQAFLEVPTSLID